MAYAFPPDVKLLVEAEMKSGRYKSEDDLLRDALDALASESEELEAIRAALAEWQNGDPGISIKDAFQTIRDRRKISSDA
jgi:Arc/MetJ-type ribon-helix-helix transcriptional regulator